MSLFRFPTTLLTLCRAYSAVELSGDAIQRALVPGLTAFRTHAKLDAAYRTVVKQMLRDCAAGTRTAITEVSLLSLFFFSCFAI